MNQFGTHLRDLRERCRDPIFPARKLSQQKFGEFLGNELGTHGYSGAAISDWERGKSKIHADDRLVLVALLKVLYDHGGLETLQSANQLLESGNYRALDDNEARVVFDETPFEEPSEHQAHKRRTSKSIPARLLQSLFAVPEKEANTLLARARRGPNPVWPRILAVFMQKMAERFSFSVNAILWVGVGVFALWLIGPSLRLPFDSREVAFRALSMYAIGSLMIPLLIGLLVNTKDNEYWKQRGTIKPFLLRLYTYQGAGIGFNSGYFFVLPISLVRYYLNLEHTIWIEVAAVTVGLILGNMGARVTPHNLLLAYKHLNLTDGAIFFVVALMGPLWAAFFFEFYSMLLTPALGISIILLSLLAVVIIGRYQASRTP